MYECCAFVHLCTMYVHCPQKRALDPLELELEMVVSPVGVQGIKLGSSGKAASVFNHQVTSPVPNFCFLWWGME